MKDRHTGLAERRAQLQRQAAAQREQLGGFVDSIEARFHGVDRGLLNMGRFLRKPALLAGGAALAFFMGPRRALRLVGNAMLLIGAARRVLRLIR